MTEVNFHHNAGDPLDYACRLLHKAHQRGARVAVTGAAPALGRLDELLWTFEPLAFVPHARLRGGEAPSERLAPTPIWLVERPEQAPSHEVLLNLGPAVATGFESFERLFEIVGNDEDARAAGRERLRHYRSRGYEIQLHEVRA